MRELITSLCGPQPKFHYTPCVKSGPLGFVSGMIALDPDTGLLIEADAAAQTQRIFDNLRRVLPDYGYTLDELCMARIYTTCFDRFADINRVWSAQFTESAPPARTSVGVAALPMGALVEIEFLFHKI